MLEVKGLRKTYGDRTVLDGVDLVVPTGQIHGFIGPNGAGKSTTMRCVMGVVAPDGGRLTWQGRPIDRRARQRFGYMPEERGLYQKMRVAEQVEYFGRLNGLTPRAARARTDDLLEVLQVASHRTAAVQSLSLGNQQRVQLAVALVHDPELLVLDEPFSGLDPVGVRMLADVLRERTVVHGATILFSSHQLEIVEQLVDQVSIIKDGCIVEAAGRTPEGRGLLRITVADGAIGWAGRLPGRVVEHHADTVLLDPMGTHPNEVVATAASEGRLEHFGWEQPTLSQTFQEVVA